MAETRQEQEDEDEDVEEEVQDVAVTQIIPSAAQQGDNVADDKEVFKG